MAKAKDVVVVPAPVSAVDVILQSTLSEDNIADTICQIGQMVESIGKAYHFTMTWMIGQFGKNAVFGINGNKCRNEDAKKKHAVELGIEFPAFQRLFAIFETVNSRRPDSWRQAKNCYLTVEKAITEQGLVSTQDKPQEVLQLEIDVETAKAKVASAKADKQRAQIEVAKAKLDGLDTTELAKKAEAAKAAFEAADKERQDIQAKLQAKRDASKADNEWAEYSKRVEALAEWCNKHDAYKDMKSRILDLLNV